MAQCKEIEDGTPLLIMFSASVAVLFAALSLLVFLSCWPNVMQFEARLLMSASHSHMHLVWLKQAFGIIVR